MNEEQMLYLLDKGYTPEYVSLVKWQKLRRQVINGTILKRNDIGSRTCAMCEVYNDCDDCPISTYFIHCDNSTAVWLRMVRFTLNNDPIPLHLITQMVNQLQYLVAEYGKYQTKP